MGECQIESRGFSIGRWRFPEFSLRVGESITLCLPKEAIADQQAILAAITGSKLVSGLTVCGASVLAEPASGTSGWRRWFSETTPFDWMKGHTTLSDDAISTYLHKHRMDGRTSLNRYAGTPRMVLGLAAAIAQNPDVLVFSTGGLDPSGIREVFQVVTEHLSDCSVIYLAWPSFSLEQYRHESFPGSLIVPVTEMADLSAPVVH